MDVLTISFCSPTLFNLSVRKKNEQTIRNLKLEIFRKI